MRICIVYDCLYPYTVGGAERWYRNVAERLAEQGHEVTYLTLRQWLPPDAPNLHGVRVVAVAPRMELYASGRRRVLPPLLFGLGTFWHLLWHGRRYDVVHTASFPYFSVLAAAAAKWLGGFRLIVDWHELWTQGYWREYLGPLGGRVGAAVQSLCLRVPQTAICFSRLHQRRLREHGVESVLLEGEYAGDSKASLESAEPVVVFAGRHIPEKGVLALPGAIARARAEIPELRCEIYGDGPQRPELLEAINAHGLVAVVSAPGFVPAEQVARALESALCVVLPSRREGYGLVVVEASAVATPAVVVAGADNAAAELIDEGVNGFVAPTASPEDLAEAVVRVHRAGQALRESTAAWFQRNAERLSLESSLQVVVDIYASSARS